MPTAATAFSWELYIAGVPFEHFGNISISQAVSGYGTSGVVTATMTVTTNNKTYGGSIISGDDLPINAEVVLTCSDENIKPPTFYVTSRQVDGNITKWTCCDIMSKTEKTLELTDSDFDENDKISFSVLAEKIKLQCGFTNIDCYGFSAISGKTVDKDSCSEVTARNVLETIAEALCGYWIASGMSISFVPFGRSNFSAEALSWAEINYCGRKTFSKVIVSDNSENIYISGSGDNYSTLVCETDYASQELADFILSVMLGTGTYYTYQAWKCEKGKAASWIYCGDIVFGNTDILRCNSVTLYPSASGLYFTASRNNVVEDETSYMSEVQRQLRKKLELDKINNNVAITKKGIYFFENGYKNMTASEQQDAKYGFTVDKGVTEYDGAMISKIMPKTAYWNEDKTQAIVSYKGKKFEYHIKKDSNGNVTDFYKEEIKEES